MKKLKFLLIILLLLTFNYVNANFWNATVNSISTAETNCSVTWNARYYLGVTTYLLDILWQRWTPKNWFIWFSSTKVWVYNPNNNIRINGWFQFTSRLLPENENEVVALFNLWWTNILNHPVNRNDLAAQVVYEVTTATTKNWSNNWNFWYSTYYNNIWQNRSTNINNFAVDSSTINSEKECFNIYVSWCWDWTIDSGNWETCDNWALNWTTWNSCSATCTAVNTPATCQNWWVWWVLSNTITSATPNLCQNWIAVWNFTSTVNWNTTNYTWSCWWISWWNCSASYTSNPPTPPGWGGGGWGGWGWSSATCFSLSATNTSWWAPLTSSFTCNTNSSQYTIDIRNTTWWANTLLHTFTNAWGNYTFNSNWTYTAQCYAWPANNTDVVNCKKAITVWNIFTPTWWWTNFCWDWILQRPNASWINEQCDFWTNPWPNWCIQSSCQINENTTPWWWNIDINPVWDILIWHNMSVLWNLNTSVEVKNTSTSDIFIEKPLCIYKTSNPFSVLNWNSICSSWNIWYVGKMWWTKQISIPQNQFIWNTSLLPTWIDYADAQLTTTLQWLENVDTFLKSNLKVRVAKPTVSTIWWWASLLNGTNFSDISSLPNWWFALLNPAINKNLILSSLWVNPLSSYVKSTNDSNLVNISKTKWQQELNNFETINSNAWYITISQLPAEKFNWFENVFIHKWNVNLNSLNINGWNKTYIIENWDLNINWNITSDSNVLLVVKWWWKIHIANNVTNIDAILINIWWEIVWDTYSTLERLIINWALYWNVNNLLSKRTYIKDRWAYVDVWTNINFTSKIFNSPPPLLTSFLWEYSQSQKVPK